MKKIISIIVKLVLAIAVIVLTYYIIAGINKPIDFEDARMERFNLTISKLKDIRTAQIAYKDNKGYYTPSFDSLINYIKTGNIKVVRAVGFVPDSLTEKEAIKLGIVSRDTFLVPIKDSLFKHITYPIDSINRIPCGKRTLFKMDTSSVLTGSGVEVKVFQCYALYKDILDGLDKQLIINYKSVKKDSCIKVGSLTEANNNAGNWGE